MLFATSHCFPVNTYNSLERVLTSCTLQKPHKQHDHESGIVSALSVPSDLPGHDVSALMQSFSEPVS